MIRIGLLWRRFGQFAFVAALWPICFCGGALANFESGYLNEAIAEQDSDGGFAVLFLVAFFGFILWEEMRKPK